MHQEIRELMGQESNTWETFKWTVCIRKRGFQLDHLRQLARVQNWKHEDDAWIATTLYETFVGLIEEFHSLHKQHPIRKPTAAAVSYDYEGVKHSIRRTMYQTAVTGLRLHAYDVYEIGNIMNEEHADMSASQLLDGRPGRADHTQATRYVDCRKFRNFINLTSL